MRGRITIPASAVAAVALGLLVATHGVAQPAPITSLRLAIADTQRIFEEYVKTETADEILQTAVDRLEQETREIEDEIRGLQERLQKQRLFIDDESKVREMEVEIRDKQENRLQLLDMGRSALEEKQAELTEPILVEIREVIAEIGNRDAYDLIIEKRLVTLFHRPELEITDEIIATLNERAAEEAGSNDDAGTSDGGAEAPASE